MKFIKLILPLAFASSIFGAGYKIPEQSSDSMALAASNVAKSFGADAAYYNPANMVFMEDKNHISFNPFYIHLSPTKFKNSSKVYGTVDTKSKDYNVAGATLYYVSPFFADRFRFGLSFNAPAGLSIEWQDPYSASVAKKFELKIYEFAPSVAYQVTDKLGFAIGPRAIYTSGVIESETRVPHYRYHMSREVKGDAFDIGYNLALTYRPTENLSFSATYRSEVDIKVEGDTDLFENGSRRDIETNIKIPLPATLNLALAYDISDWSFMFAYERTFWSAFEKLDFNYDSKVSTHPITLAIIDDPHDKKWKDSNTYRFGVTYKATDRLRLMAGFGIDDSIAQDRYVSFEMPDAKAYIYSFGADYKVRDDLNVGFGYLYQDRQSRKASKKGNLALNTIDGEFDPGDAQLFSISLKYKF